jgi:hypothetical protein
MTRISVIGCPEFKINRGLKPKFDGNILRISRGSNVVKQKTGFEPAR